jgi:hypothetical protein
MASQDVHVYVVTPNSVLFHGTSTTNSQGEFQVSVHTPAVMGTGEHAMAEVSVYFQIRHMGFWEYTEDWLIVGDWGDFDYEQYLDVDTVLSVEPFRPGGVVEVTLTCPEADGVDETGGLSWGLGDIDDWFYEPESMPEWGLVSSWGSVWMPTRDLPMTWEDGAYHASFVFPAFLGSEMTISFLGGVVFSEYPEMDARLDILEGVQPMPPNEAPEVVMTTQVDGKRYSDDISVSGTASDDEEVLMVEYRVDGGDWTEADGDETWSFYVDLSGLASGDHTLEVRSYDGEKYSTFTTAAFVVDHAPGVALTFPVAGVILNGSVSFNGTASDDLGISWVEYRIDGADWLIADGDEVWTALVDTTKLTKGDHTFEVRTFDGTVYSDPADVTFGVDQPPEVDLRAHEDGMKYKDKAEFMGVASDDGEVVRVEARIDGGEWMDVTGTTDWSFKATQVKLSEGEHTLEVRSFDGTQYSDVHTTAFVYEKKDEDPGFGTVAAIMAILAVVPTVRWRRRR